MNVDGNENDGFPLQSGGVALVIYILLGLGGSLRFRHCVGKGPTLRRPISEPALNFLKQV